MKPELNNGEHNSPNKPESIDVLSPEARQYVDGSRKVLNEFIPNRIDTDSEYEKIQETQVRALFFDTIILNLMILSEEDKEKYIQNPIGPIDSIKRVLKYYQLSEEQRNIVENGLNIVTDEDVKAVIPFYNKIGLDSSDQPGEILQDNTNILIYTSIEAEKASLYFKMTGY